MCVCLLFPAEYKLLRECLESVMWNAIIHCWFWYHLMSIIWYMKNRSKWNHRYQTINLVYVIITTKFYSYKLSLENHWAPHDHSKWNVQKCWRIKMIEHLSSLHSCCEYCDTDNIQLSNKVCISYTEKHELTNTIWRTFLLSNLCCMAHILSILW